VRWGGVGEGGKGCGGWRGYKLCGRHEGGPEKEGGAMVRMRATRGKGGEY
jgi:hypothetical protein